MKMYTYFYAHKKHYPSFLEFLPNSIPRNLIALTKNDSNTLYSKTGRENESEGAAVLNTSFYCIVYADRMPVGECLYE